MIKNKNTVQLSRSTIAILVALSVFKSMAISGTTITSNARKIDSINAKSGSEFLIYPAANSLQIAGEEFWLDINVGIENNPVKSLFGVSFVLNYSNCEYIDVVSYDSIVPGKLLGSDVLFYPHLEDENGKISAGITRKLGSSGVNGYGTLVRIKYISAQDTPHRTPVHFMLSSVTANDSAGNPIELVPKDTTIWIIQPDFELRIDPTTRTIKSGQTATYQVSIIPTAGFADSITLSISGLEALAYGNWEFKPGAIFPDQTSLLTISTSVLTPPGTYVFEVIGKSHTLTHKVSATLIIEPDGSILPNPFTPNGDGQNDFVIFNISGLLENRGEVVIYNLRGRQVRELSGQNRWDGKNEDGEDLPLGLYLYVVKVDGDVKAKGTLTLVR